MDGTPKSERLHIGIYGPCNCGKSSLLNALTGREAALVSTLAGTTTDPVSVAMEFAGIGAVVLLDTPGFDDPTPLGQERQRQSRRSIDRTDIAVVLCDVNDTPAEAAWIEELRRRDIPVVAVLNKCDQRADPAAQAASVERRTGLKPLCVSATTGEGIPALRAALVQAAGVAAREVSITGSLARQGDTVLLVMPQDAQAPRGRLILPQAQTIRELLDKGCTSVCCTPERLEATLSALSAPPQLIVTDSQVFSEVCRLAPKQSLVTSFSILFARYKGDLRAFVEGARAIDRLTPRSRVLIAEACAHAPQGEDIGRVKIPRLLRGKVGEELRIDFTAGNDFPEELTPYDLIIHCGACMFNRRHVLSRIARASEQGVPITNYGIAIAALSGILDRIVLPGDEEADFSK